MLFADFELEAHRRVERDEPITADTLSALYLDRFRAYYGDAVDEEELTRITWARIPHFFQSPYYVYQYATSFAASAQLLRELRASSGAEHAAIVERYLRLLRAGGNDYPIEQLLQAGVDLRRPEPTQAVVAELDRLVTQLEEEIAAAT